MAQKRAYNKEQTENALSDQREIEPPNYRKCISDACLKGPFSPLETTLHTLMYASREKEVHIEWSSVNSVLLDTNPQEVYERLLVAAEVGQNQMSNKLTLRHTTMMPNIRGLPAIIALLFCPTAELRRDVSGSRYVSALCGLGSNARGDPYFPEHDILVNIDADLSVHDIGLINHIRYLTDCMIFVNDGEDVPSSDEEFRSQVHKCIRSDLMELVQKRRKQQTPVSVARAWEWRSVPEEELLEISVPDMVEQAVVFPMHKPLELCPVSRDTLIALKKEIDQLKIRAARTMSSSNIELECKLCGTLPMPTHAMRIHLCSNSHKEKEEDFRIIDT